MLPRSLYELLPYLYVVAGIACGFLIRSTLIMVASMLLISAGLLTMYMRYQYRNNLREEACSRTESDRRRGMDRRQCPMTSFPVIDDCGNLIHRDRRHSDRRGGMQQSYA